MARARMEILVEPFRENEPGPHVEAVLDVFRGRGLVFDLGPFATTVEGELDDLLEAVSALLSAGFAEGADSIQTRVELV